MGSFSEDEDQRFFDAHDDDVASIGDANSEGDDNEGVSVGFDYEAWIRSPISVQERRSKFMKRMGLGMNEIVLENSLDVCSVNHEEEVMDRVKDCSGVVNRTCDLEEEYSSTRLSMSMSCCSSVSSSHEFCLVENLPCQDGDLEKGVEGNVDKEDGKMNDGRDLGSDQLVVAKESEDNENGDVVTRKINRMRRGWFRRLKSMTCMVDRQGEGDNGREVGRCSISGYRLQKVKVRQCRKKMKELSALYLRQDIQAHEGSILTMKFSPDGQYLASGGEDGVVRLWQVVMEDRCNEIHIPEIDPSSIYFTADHLSQLTPLFMDKEKLSKLKSMRKTSDSACVIFPPKIFRLLEKPLREFRGHISEVLDLSWSKNNVSECHNSVI